MAEYFGREQHALLVKEVVTLAHEAMRSCGGPPFKKSGTFCLRTKLFMRSIADTPVSMKSLGRARRTGLSGEPLMRKRFVAAIGSPPSIG